MVVGVVSVVVPVFRGVDDVRRCVGSLMAHAGPVEGVGSVEVVVVDDCSPEPEVSALCDEVAAGSWPWPVRLLRNSENLGFVATVNRAIDATSGDVVILNSDTQVTAGWLQRMVDAASAPGVATVTPLTNFGSLCTIPPVVSDAFGLFGDDPQTDACAAFVARHSLRRRPEVISGVGFCMYITRDALDLVGSFDTETFGMGYGEEVDFCLRATRVGFTHVVEDATFVYHAGGGSFGNERNERMKRGSSLLHDRYRFFRAANTAERSADPLRIPFKALELGLHERDESRPHVLHVLHSAPDALGGTEKHLRELMESMADTHDFSILCPVESGYVLRTLWHHPDRPDPTEIEFLLPGGPRRVTKIIDEVAASALRCALDMFHFDAVHLQNLIGHSLAPLDVLSDFDGPVVCSVRDLYLACPHHWLLWRNEQACGIPDDLSVCADCLPVTRQLSIEYLEEFRTTVAAHLDTIDAWVFASQSAEDYLRRVYDLPPERVHHIPHGAIINPHQPTRTLDVHHIYNEPLRLAFIGLGWTKKGLDVANHLAEHFAGTPIEIHHYGTLKQPASPHLHTHGPYDNTLLPHLLHTTGIHIALLPGPYAETFGHVMTEATIAGLPTIAATYGALGERIRTQACGWTIDPHDPTTTATLIEHLDHCREELHRATHNATHHPITTISHTRDRYAALYQPTAAPKEHEG
ncbi:MAG: glycosyltransferase [Acidimicrobiia bacterium]|nr:glycosyltransferase [Acidimicrobiia bacterium]